MHRPTFFLIVFIFLGGCLSPNIESKEWNHPKCDVKKSFESGEKQVNLLELYTSEGCSSCPPAEAWVNLQVNNSNLYKSFIPVAFHVDYWDYIGHKDPLADENFSYRQRSYAKEWGNGRVYTPGFVVNGKEWGARGKSAPNNPGPKVGNLKAKVLSDTEFEVEFSKSGEYMLNAAYLIHGVAHKIRRGENSGKTLHHNFVVSNFKKRKFKDKIKIELKPRHKNFKSKSIVFWVSSTSQQKPIQAAGACLN